MGFENLIFGTFEFIHAMIDSSKFRSTVKKSMHQIVYYIIVYMQMTEDQVYALSFVHHLLPKHLGSK